MKRRNSPHIQKNRKKAFLYGFIFAILLCCLTAFTGCGKAVLPSPLNLKYDKGTNELIWDQVENSTDGYTVEISGDQFPVKEYSVKGAIKTDIDTGEVIQEPHPAWFSLPSLDTGTYYARVKALTKDLNYYRNSDWSAIIRFRIEKESGITYRLINDGTEYVVDKMGSASGNIEIFSTYNGKPVTAISDLAFSGVAASRLTGIIIGPNVTSIGAEAFRGCSRMANIVLPENLISIGARAFQNCFALVDIVIPDSVTSVGERAFQNCRGLESIKISDNMTDLPNYLFSDCTILKNVTIGKKVTSIGSFTFSNCASLSSQVIPDNVTNINSYAFYGSGLESIELPAGMTYINAFAFNRCQKLSSIKIPDTITHIGQEAFSATAIWDNSQTDVVYADNWAVGCKNAQIKEITLKNDTVGIGNYAFKSLKDLASITIPDSLLHMGFGVFDETELWEKGGTGETDWIVYADKWAIGCKYPYVTEESIKTREAATLKNDTVGLGPAIFYGCIFLNSINFPSGLKTIGDYAFFGCGNLEDMSLPSGLKIIGDYAFAEMRALVDIDSETGAISYSGLKSITIPSGIKSIGDYAFYGCYLLEGITIPSGVTNIGNGVFSACIGLKSVSIPNSITSIGDNAFQSCYELESITIPSGVTSIGSGAFLDSAIKSISLPSGLKSINDETFSYCSNLTKITLPQGLLSIGNKAFYASGLTTITIPKGVTSIGAYAFSYCTSLSDITILEGVKHIGEGTFQYSYALKNVTLPSGLISIGELAFSDIQNLRAIIIPDSVTSIGRYAFFNCINLAGVTLSINLIRIAEYAFANCSAIKTFTLGNNIIGIGSHVFFGAYNLTLYVEASRRREDWSVHWNSGHSPVIWGCTLSADKSHVESFTKTENSIMNFYSDPAAGTITVLSAPYRQGCSFVGWTQSDISVVPDFTAAGVVNAPDGITLYAIWLIE